MNICLNFSFFYDSQSDNVRIINFQYIMVCKYFFVILVAFTVGIYASVFSPVLPLADRFFGLFSGSGSGFEFCSFLVLLIFMKW